LLGKFGKLVGATLFWQHGLRLADHDGHGPFTVKDGDDKGFDTTGDCFPLMSLGSRLFSKLVNQGFRGDGQ
jgi:hypothetical protein